jgi:hypothetical protein
MNVAESRIMVIFSNYALHCMQYLQSSLLQYNVEQICWSTDFLVTFEIDESIEMIFQVLYIVDKSLPITHSPIFTYDSSRILMYFNIHLRARSSQFTLLLWKNLISLYIWTLTLIFICFFFLFSEKLLTAPAITCFLFCQHWCYR